MKCVIERTLSLKTQQLTVNTYQNTVRKPTTAAYFGNTQQSNYLMHFSYCLRDIIWFHFSYRLRDINYCGNCALQFVSEWHLLRSTNTASKIKTDAAKSQIRNRLTTLIISSENKTAPHIQRRHMERSKPVPSLCTTWCTLANQLNRKYATRWQHW